LNLKQNGDISHFCPCIYTTTISTIRPTALTLAVRDEQPNAGGGGGGGGSSGGGGGGGGRMCWGDVCRREGAKLNFNTPKNC
jgi:hypothetical protein